MFSEIGFGVMAIAFLLCLYGCGAATYGRIKRSRTWIESARVAALCIFPLLTLALICLLVLILQGRYEVQYVFEVSSSTLPTYLKVAALWGGQSGSLLFWCWLSAGVGFLYILKNDEEENTFPWTMVVLLISTSFFVGLTIFSSNPFERFFIGSNGESILAILKPGGALEIIPPDGIGLNPLLRHPAMAFHPPVLYLGFTIFLVPFATLLAALIEGKKLDDWLVRSRPWILTGWIFLSIGLLLGSRWAYDVLGWGGYWGWDPVEIAALMPWLGATALLHNLLLGRNERLSSRWIAALVILTFSLVILGTFITRSGLITSVHAFSESRVGRPLLVFIGVLLIPSCVLLGLRWKALGGPKGVSQGFSKKIVVRLTNAVLLAILLVCLWGVFYPVVAEGIFHQSISITPVYYKSASGPLFLTFFILMGVCPLIGWGATTWRMLGRKIWLPASFASLAVIVILLAGIHSWLVLLVGWVLFFAGAASIQDIILRSFHRSNGKDSPGSKESTGIKIYSHMRKFGAFLVHIGILSIAAGVVGMEFFQFETERTIQLKESLTIYHYTLTLDSIHTESSNDLGEISTAEIHAVRVDGGEHTLTAQREYYPDARQYVTFPARWGDLREELYVVLAAVNSDSSATFKIFVNPLVNWLWIGGIGLAAGGALALAPVKAGKIEKRKKVKLG